MLGGPKVRAFYRALVGMESAVVLDVHMLRIIGESESPKPPKYAAIADTLARAAHSVGVKPAPFQAALWIHVRGHAG